MRRCSYCGVELPRTIKPGRTRKYCSARCRKAASRARNKVPSELRKLPRWIRWGNYRGRDKCPLSARGYPLSIHKDDEWLSYEEANKAHWGTGLGFVLNGDGIMCLDVDECLQDGHVHDDVKELVESAKGTYVEVSPSGRGLHIWGLGKPGKGTVAKVGRIRVEAYSQGRYITVTGNKLPGFSSRLRPLRSVLG